MKRFWKEARAQAGGEGFTVSLDGRPIRTPGRQLLTLPTQALAEAVAGEWQAVEKAVTPAAVPLTGLANAAIDIITPDTAAFAAGLARYAESDMLCYRAESPVLLVDRQAASWDPLLDWAARRFDLRFAVTAGIMHVPQPAETLDRIGKAYAGRSAFELAALSPLTTLTGSAILPLALAEDAIDPDRAWAAALLDELWQAEQWGEDAEAGRSRDDRRRNFDAALGFLSALRMD